MWRSGKRPLQLVMAFEPFMKLALDFMGLIKLVAKSIGVNIFWWPLIIQLSG